MPSPMPLVDPVTTAFLPLMLIKSLRFDEASAFLRGSCPRRHKMRPIVRH
jgi:hypothetical protein